MFSDGLIMLGVENNRSNSAQESSPNKKSHNSSDDFLANKYK